MKRNEKILVYGVTGFLVAILVIAVVFGNEDLTRAVEDRPNAGPLTLDQVLTSNQGEEGSEPTVAGIPGEEASGEAEAGTETEAEAPVPATIDPSQFIGPLAARPTPEIVSVLGNSRREGDYRLVTVRAGDTFRSLVQRWCGSTDYEGDVERLNERISKDALSPGVELWLPWIEDQTLLDAHADREREVRERAAAAPAVYTIKNGDSLWKLAEGAVGLGGAPAYMEEIKALNPEIEDFNRLRVGQRIRLPKHQRP